MDKPNPDDLSFSFQLTAADYRRMMYFNTFGQRPLQSGLLLVAWVVCLVVILLEKFNAIRELATIVEGCLLLVSALIPLLVATAEFNIYRVTKKRGAELAVRRTLTFTETGISQSRDNGKKAGFEKWSAFQLIFESKTLFVIYRSATEILILPKRAITHPDDLEDLRDLFSEKLEKRYINRA